MVMSTSILLVFVVPLTRSLNSICRNGTNRQLSKLMRRNNVLFSYFMTPLALCLLLTHHAGCAAAAYFVGIHGCCESHQKHDAAFGQD